MRTQSQHDDPSHALSYFEPVMPIHFYMVEYIDLYTYNKTMGNLLWQENM
jgi:hypothetical protein